MKIERDRGQKMYKTHFPTSRLESHIIEGRQSRLVVS